MDYIWAFLVGGLVCALAQILMEKTKLMPGRIMVILVCTGAALHFLGIFEPLQEFAGAGITVPLLGFGKILMEGNLGTSSTYVDTESQLIAKDPEAGKG